MPNSSSPNPPRFHTRSATLPNASDPTARPFHEDGRSRDLESHVKGLPLDIPSTIPESFSPSPPIRAHHRSNTEDSNSTRVLPPLVTRPQQPTNTTELHEFDHFATSEISLRSPGSSRRASPARNSFEFDHHGDAKRKTSLTQLGEPFQSRESSRLGSPTRRCINTTKDTNAEETTKVNKLASWFQGESQPIKVTLVPSPTTKENVNALDPVKSTTTSTRQTGVLHRKSTSQVLPAMASRFSFFNSKASLPKPATNPSRNDDELAELDVHKALFPEGVPDPLSPTAFKNLQQQAEGLLTRLQIAHKERATALKDALTEKEVLNEETQGAETRARHLKMQLDAMAEQLAEQDKAMMTMVDELAQEKLARREEEEFRKRSVRLVEKEPTSPTAPLRSRPRRSTISDSGVESEDESSAESVFSRRDGTYSPTMSMSSVSTTDNSPDMFHSREILNSPTHAARLRIPASAVKPVQQAPCTTCHGVRPSDAWSVVGILKEENQGLKQRIGELEGALDGCLHIVGGL